MFWPLEDTLKFKLLDPEPEGQGFELYNLYSLKMPEIMKVWVTLRRNASDYIPVVREIKGNTPAMTSTMRRKLQQQRRNFHSSAEPVHYGLNLISPIKEAISLRPSATDNE